MLMRVGSAVLEMTVALHCDATGTTCNLMMMTMARELRLKVKAMTLLAMLLEIAPTRPQLNSSVRCEGGCCVWTVIQDLVYFEFEHYV
jgi:hypothetical protein